MKSDPKAGTYPECKVVYTLQAANAAGEYSISAAFLYGTEQATALGRVEGPGGASIRSAAVVPTRAASLSSGP